MAQLSAAIDGLSEACTALGTPITGGNVSLYNETKGEGIYPTPVIGIVGIIDDVTKSVPNYFSRPGDVVLLWQPYFADLDDQSDDFLYERPFGSSQYAATILRKLWGTPPGIALAYDAQVLSVIKTLASKGLASSISDISDGGVAVALAKASFTGGVGAKVDINGVQHGGSMAIGLFSEPACTMLITCDRASVGQINDLISDAKLGDLRNIGITETDSIEISYAGQNLVSASVKELSAAYLGTLPSLLTEVHA
jgi:phosphoribosylformylglycinamidine synthase subunit PurL